MWDLFSHEGSWQAGKYISHLTVRLTFFPVAVVWANGPDCRFYIGCDGILNTKSNLFFQKVSSGVQERRNWNHLFLDIPLEIWQIILSSAWILNSFFPIPSYVFVETYSKTRLQEWMKWGLVLAIISGWMNKHHGFARFRRFWLSTCGLPPRSDLHEQWWC